MKKHGTKLQDNTRGTKMKNDPREITAKFDSICAETGKKIAKGENCVYYPTSKQVFSKDSKQAEAYRAWRFDVECLGQNY